MLARKLQFVPRFESRLGKETEPVADNLNEDILSGDPDTALTTIAFLFGNVTPLRLSAFGVRTAMLALYAAGARITLTRAELWELSAAPQRYADIFSLPEYNGVLNGKLVKFVLNRAKQRGHKEDIPAGSYLENIGYRLIRLQNAATCVARDTEDDQVELRTIAFESLNPDPLRVSAAALALAMLATWAAGADAQMTTEQYRQLEREASLNLHTRQAECKTEKVRFVLAKAAERALTEKLIEAEPVAA